MLSFSFDLDMFFLILLHEVQTQEVSHQVQGQVRKRKKILQKKSKGIGSVLAAVGPLLAHKFLFTLN